MEHTRPVLEPVCAQALQVWNFCEGWHPERLPIALAYVGVREIELVIDLQLDLRTFMAQRQDFSRRVAQLMQQTKTMH